MTRRATLPADLDGRPFRVAEGLNAGVARGRFDASDLRAEFHGARAPVGVDRLRALVPLLDAGQALTGPTAAELLGLPLPLRFRHDRRIHVSSRAPQAAMRRHGIVGTQRSDGQPMLIAGIPLLEPPRVWMALAAELSEADLVAVADRLISGTLTTPPLCARADLERELGRASGVRGVVRLRAALGRAREGSWSRPETFVRLLIGELGLPEPELNAATVIDEGGVVYPDLSWSKYRVAVEYDGRWHDASGRREKDSERHERFVDAQWSVIHVRAEDVFGRPSALAARLIRRLSSAGAPTRDVDFARLPRFSP